MGRNVDFQENYVFLEMFVDILYIYRTKQFVTLSVSMSLHISVSFARMGLKCCRHARGVHGDGSYIKTNKKFPRGGVL